jgi:hypothetical protein
MMLHFPLDMHVKMKIRFLGIPIRMRERILGLKRRGLTGTLGTKNFRKIPIEMIMTKANNPLEVIRSNM